MATKPQLWNATNGVYNKLTSHGGSTRVKNRTISAV
jgi:hypothetical protein